MFDRKSQFDRSFFDRVLSGISLPARIAGKFSVVRRTTDMTVVERTSEMTVTIRTNPFTVVAFK